MITRTDVIGGAQIHIRDVAAQMVKLGHEAHVLSGHAGDFVEDLTSKGIYFHEIPSLRQPIHLWQDLKALFVTRALLKKIKPDLVSCHSSKAGLIGRLASYSLSIPTLFTVHGWSFRVSIMSKLKILAYVFLEKLAANFCDCIITVSAFDYHLGIKYKIISPEKLNIIHNGVMDYPLSLPEKELRPPLPLRVIMTARFEEPKDHLTLVEACRNLPEIELWFIGDGLLEDSIKTKVIKYSMQNRVHFLGRRKDVAELMTQCDVFALISDSEGFPRSTLEAMRAGLPVIVSDVGGAKEAIIEGENGFSIQRGDVSALHQALLFFINNSDRLPSMGGLSRKLFEQKFNFSIMFYNTYDIYDKILLSYKN